MHMEALGRDIEQGEILEGQRDYGKKRMAKRLPQIEVRFEGLRVDAEIRVGKRLLPTLLNSTINAAEDLLGFLRLLPSKKRPVRILDDMTGILRPSRMTLILGHPGSGKSTFLRALAGKLDPSLKVSGKVTYNGQDLSNFVPQPTCAYVSQHDLHHAEMTVRETLNFSGRMLGSNEGHGILRDMMTMDRATKTKVSSGMYTCEEEEERNFVTEYVLKILGLQECADIIVGDEMRRGISGGEKKRVTIGEMLVGLARCFFMDDISTGLDSSTTFEMVKFLRQMTDWMDLTMAISLLQPPPETFDLFDDIILICEGKIIYLGPCKDVLGFFESMGFKCPKRKNTTDFLQEVTSRVDQAQYWARSRSTYEFVSVKTFAESFKSMCLNQFPDEELQKEHDQSNGDILTIIKGDSISRWEHFKACFSREWLLMKRNSPVHIFKTIQIALLGLIIMTIFFRIEMKHQSVADGNRFMGAMFAAVVIVKFNGMTELSMTVRRLPTFYKQRELLFLPGWAVLSSIVLLSIPMSFLETAIWTGLTYYVIGFAPSVIRFFQQFLALFCVHQMSMAVFRFIAVVGRTQVMSNIIGTATLIAFYILGGFVISKDDIQPWLAWGHWISPLTYGQNAVAVNEFLDERWSMQFQYGWTTDTVGRAILRARGMFTEMHLFWICIGALLGFSLLFNIFSVFALGYLRAPATQGNIYITTDTTKVVKADEQISEESPQSSLLPFQPLTLAFSHISYSVDMPKEMEKHGVREKRLQLLHDVNGAFRPGVLTALMGITGAGKTTLLDILAGRKTGGYIEGSISISGYPKKQDTFARTAGYCEQTDIHSPFLTVYESIQFSAWLRVPGNIQTPIRNLFVNEVMDLVELKFLKNALVGLPGISGLSGEQRKRLTIAVELVSSPSIIFMDEPTTGLDARSAAIVMRSVRKTVDTGRTVVCTIHQPSIEIFEAFDELLLLKRGQLIYGGPTGPLSQNMVHYFEAIPGVPKLKDGRNPATWMLDVTSSSVEVRLHIDYAKIFQDSDICIKNLQLVDELSKPQPNSEELHFPSKYVQSFKAQCKACIWKANVSHWKNPELNVSRLVTTIASSLLFGMVFWGIGSKITTEQDIFNIFGAMYGLALFLGFTSSSMVQPIVGMERSVFYRERSSRMYSSMPYACAQVIVEIPYITIQVLITSAIAYSMIGFQFTVAKLCWFMFFMLMSFIYFTLSGMMMVALTPTLEIAAIFSFFMFVSWNIFSGFFIPRTMIPIWWRWYYWASPSAWTIYGLMVSQLGDQQGLISVPGRADQSVKEFVEDYLGLQDEHFPLIVLLHLGIVLLFLLTFTISITKLNFQRR